MNKILIALILAAPAFFLVSPLRASEETRPKEGRVITTVTPRVEFYVTPERRVRLTFLDAAGMPMTPGAQVVTLTAGERSAPTKLAFDREGDALISRSALPEGSGYPLVLQIKSTPEAKTDYVRFNLNLSSCPGCNRMEYACTCEH